LIVGNYPNETTEDLIKEINRASKKLNSIKSAGALWVISGVIKGIRAELDSRIKDADKVTRMIVEAET
jgi:hypothetical protein